MPGIVVLGAQWGDEGKGKATDQLTTTTPIELLRPHERGHNVGHTSWSTARSRHDPAAQRHPDPRLGVGDRQRRGGLAEALFRELDAMLERGGPDGWLVVSANAHVTASNHSTIDKVTSASWARRISLR